MQVIVDQEMLALQLEMERLQADWEFYDDSGDEMNREFVEAQMATVIAKIDILLEKRNGKTAPCPA